VTAKIHPAISWAPVILLPIFAVLREMYYYPVYLKLVREDHLLEWIQSLTYFASSILALFVAVHLLRNQERILGWLYIGLFMGLLFVAIEEISWGQRIFGLESPEFFMEFNRQEETNVHNLRPVRLVEHYIFILIGAYGCFAHLLWPRSITTRYPSIIAFVTPHRRLFFYFFPVFAWFSYFEFMEKVIGSRPEDVLDQEVAEFFLAFGFFFFLATNCLRVNTMFPQPSRGD